MRPLKCSLLAVAAFTVSPTPLAAAAPATPPAQATTPLLRPIVVARYPHDTNAFTEGLIWDAGTLVESVGLEGRSDVRRVDLPTGKVRARAALPAAQFGEGVAAWKG